MTKINIPEWGEYQGIIPHLLSSYKIVMKKENTIMSKNSLIFSLGFLRKWVLKRSARFTKIVIDTFMAVHNFQGVALQPPLYKMSKWTLASNKKLSVTGS